MGYENISDFDKENTSLLSGGMILFREKKKINIVKISLSFFFFCPYRKSENFSIRFMKNRKPGFEILSDFYKPYALYPLYYSMALP